MLRVDESMTGPRGSGLHHADPRQKENGNWSPRQIEAFEELGARRDQDDGSAKGDEGEWKVLYVSNPSRAP